MKQKRRRQRKEGGFTLVEVVVATLVSAMMVTAFFSFAMTSRMQSARADHKLLATQHAQRLLEELKNYVVDPTQTSSLPAAGVLPGDASGTWALDSSVIHDVSSILTADTSFTGLTNVSMKYCVADQNTTAKACPGLTQLKCASGTACLDCPASAPGMKCVGIQVYWDEKAI